MRKKLTDNPLTLLLHVLPLCWICLGVGIFFWDQSVHLFFDKGSFPYFGFFGLPLVMALVIYFGMPLAYIEFDENRVYIKRFPWSKEVGVEWDNVHSLEEWQNKIYILRFSGLDFSKLYVRPNYHNSPEAFSKNEPEIILVFRKNLKNKKSV